MTRSKPLSYISLFSGIEAASCAWKSLGWEPIAFSEIEPFPKAVLAHHYPNVPDLGDITKIDWSQYVDTADIVVGGSPCQSFSIAGRREGLKGASGLMFEYIRAVRELRPQWFVWENVPGALTSERGAAFRQLLSEMDELGYGLAWRVLDAQFYGVPQRRRRVFLVGSLGTQRSAEVLFEPESLSWNIASSREKRQALTRGIETGTRTTGFDYNAGASARSIAISDELSPTLKTEHSPAVYQIAGDCLTPWDGQSRRVYRADGVYPTLEARGGKAGADSKAVLWAAGSGSNMSHTSNGDDVFPALCAHMGTGRDNVPPVYCASDSGSAVAFAQNQRDEVRDLQDCAGALAAQPGIKQQTFVYCSSDSGSNSSIGEDIAPTLTAHDAKSTSYVSVPATLQIRSGKAGGGKGALVAEDMSATLTTGVQQTLFPGNGAARRLTPVECERLQGFADGWTDIPYRGKPHATDSARYKALGNSMAVPVMQWIGKRIQEVENDPE